MILGDSNIRTLSLDPIFGLDLVHICSTATAFDASVKKPFQTLYKLVLGITTDPPWLVPFLHQLLQKGLLRSTIQAAPELRELQLRFAGDKGGPDAADYPIPLRPCYPACFQDLFDANTTWKHLRYLALHEIETDEEEFLSFLTNHRGNLRTLELRSLSLLDGSWPTTFDGMRRNCGLHLEVLTLSGRFHSRCPGHVYWHFDDDASITWDVKAARRRRRVVNWILGRDAGERGEMGWKDVLW